MVYFSTQFIEISPLLSNNQLLSRWTQQPHNTILWGRAEIEKAPMARLGTTTFGRAGWALSTMCAPRQFNQQGNVFYQQVVILQNSNKSDITRNVIRHILRLFVLPHRSMGVKHG